MIERFNQDRFPPQSARQNREQTPKTSAPEPQFKKPKTIRDRFRKFAHLTAQGVGSPWAFLICLVLIVIWAVTGPMFHYSDTWQLVINTATTIVTFLMVFLIQNTQNRDARAIHLKLDELLHAVKGARNRLINLEDLTDEEMDHLQKEFERLRAKSNPLPCEDEKSKAKAEPNK